MTSTTSSYTTYSQGAVWAGRALAALVVIALALDAAVQFFAVDMLRAEMEATGFSIALAPRLGAIMAICALLFAIPATSVLGAILITGFLGGAICAHFRLGEMLSAPQLICLALGVMTWASIYLRFPGVRALLPVAR